MGVVGAGWQKSGLNLEIRVFCPLGTPKKGSVNLFYHHYKGKVFTNIFYVESLFPMCLVWAL